MNDKRDDPAVVTPRRYNEAEVAAIFERAAEAQHTSLQRVPSAEGMTLTELQEIAREVGIPGEQMTLAARAIDQSGQPTSRHFLGLPVGVGLTVNLNRKLTDDEWERIVADLRETFDARGTLRSEGSLRHWVNGNLQAHLEPTATGSRVRLRTVKGDARGLILGGLGIGGVGLTTLLVSAIGGAISASMLSSLGFMTTFGAGMFAVGAFRLPGWARLRRRQMDQVAARVAAVAGSSPTNDRR